MRVLLRLGQAELGAPGFGHRLAQRHLEVGLVVEDLDALEPVVVVGHGHIVEVEGGHVMVGEILLREGRGDLTTAVRPEIETEDHVTRTDAALLSHGGGFHEFVCRAARVGGFHHGDGAVEMVGLSLGHGVVGLGDALPPVVAVHGPIPTANGGDAGTGLIADLLQFPEVAGAQLRGGVTSIGKGMHHDIGHPGIRSDAQQGMEVGLLAVDAALAHQSHEMQPTSGFTGLGEGLEQGGLGSHGPIRHRPVDAQQVLVDRAPRADVQVPHLAVAHLPVRKAHHLAMRGQPCMGVSGQETVKMRGLRHMYRVVAIRGTDSPSIEDDERRLVHCGAKVPLGMGT